jgi:hypothetical protein
MLANKPRMLVAIASADESARSLWAVEAEGEACRQAAVAKAVQAAEDKAANSHP